MIDERQGARSLKHVVQAVLQTAVARVPAATLRAIYQRLAEQAEAGAALSPPSVRTRAPRDPAAPFHVLRAACFEAHAAGSAFVYAAVARHVLTGAGRECAPLRARGSCVRRRRSHFHATLHGETGRETGFPPDAQCKHAPMQTLPTNCKARFLRVRFTSHVHCTAR